MLRTCPQSLKISTENTSAIETIITLCEVKTIEEVTITLLHLPSTLKMFERPRLLTIDFCFIVFIFHSDAISNEITVLQGCLIEKLQFPVDCGSSLQSPEAVGPTTGSSCSL